jgi:nucleotide-binding universal stress UspA family protein
MCAFTRTRRPSLGERTRASDRPVLLATLGAPFDQAAATFAVDSAVESGSALIVANVTQLEPLALSLMLGYDALEEFTPEVSESVRRPAELAHSLGVPVERLRVRSPRPVRALLDLVRERRAGLLVFGPDRHVLKRRVYDRAVRSIKDGAVCLVWIAPVAE